MQIIKISIEKKANNIAKADAAVIRCNSRYRYLFIPYIVDNAKDLDKSLKAKIIVQHKSQKDEWENNNSLKLLDMKPEQWFNVDISSNELDLILKYCLQLKELYKKQGKGELFNSKRIMIITGGDDVEDTQKNIDLLEEHPEIKEVLKNIFKKENDLDEIVEFIKLKHNKNDFVGKLSLEEANDIFNRLKKKILNVTYMRENLNNSCENFWQTFFTTNPNILFSIIPSVYQIIDDQPYLGGKAISNEGGKVSDYLFEYGTRNSCLIEIKTPDTLLVGTKYRESYPPSSELSGSLIQIRKQKDKFMKTYHALREESAEKDILFDAYDPKCYLIIGNSDKLTPSQRSDFELFRNELKDIEIITYSELIHKLELLMEND